MGKINSLRDEKTGRFKTTTDTTRYKMVQFNNQRMSAHAREMCLSLDIPKIPKNFIVHHLDNNKRNNDINNLSLLTITAHNRIHSHKAWNKGISSKNNKKWENAVAKQRLSREKTFLKKAEETNKLYLSGLNKTQIAKILNITRSSVINRIKKYKNNYERIN